MNSSSCLNDFFTKKVVLHPFLFAIFPVLSLYVHNQGQIQPTAIILPLLLVLAVTALVFFGLARLLHNGEKAALLTTGFLLFLFLYGSFSTLIQECKFGEFVFTRNRHRLPLYTALFLGLGYGAVQLHQRWRPLTRGLNIVSLCLLSLMLLTLLGNLASGLWLRSSPRQGVNIPQTRSSPTDSPDIYYIILDGYAGAETLQKYFGYDNSPFLEYLRGKGFFLPAKARSNYPSTRLSLPSSLGMEYFRKDNQFQPPENNVRRFVETNGYQYITISSMNPALRSHGKVPHFLHGLLYNEFNLQLLRTTAIDALALRFKLYSASIRRNILSSLEQLKELPEVSGNKFVFAHIVAPHPPYVFKANGESANTFSESSLDLYKTPWDDKAGYIEQLRFLNTQAREVIDALLEKSRVPPIIVLQGDHGPKLTAPDQATAVDLHTHILNAYYLPGGGKAVLYDKITPVNSFRVIFNYFFKAHFPVLEDKCFFSRFETPFQFTEVTEAASP